ENADGDSTLAPVADGLTDALIRSLREAKLAVRSSASVAPYRGKEVSKDSIARALGVGTLIEGTIRRDGQKVRITTRLSDAGGNDLGKSANFLISRDSLFTA